MEELTGKIRKVLSQNVWYHGTVLSNWDSFCQNGVLADINRDTSDALDFGYGFYLAPTKERAEHYILSMMENSNFYNSNDIPMIMGFEFTPLEWFESETHKTKIFEKYDDDFAIFVFENRTQNLAGTKQHDYDVIYGVMSDSVPTQAILEYKMGTKTKEEVLECLKKPTSMKQISLHNQNLCDIIKLKEVYTIDKTTNERKELNINDYRK
ncbi:MAG: DUF3990 domain-containing protein [Lachnospiraceae bacterium]|nr:DUF3990 domain-containing protein [Lachnospiraceae bacterium]